MDDTCAVCAESLEWVAYGSCGHKDVCSTCVARLRFICSDRRCCICKSESSVIYVTKALGDYTKTISDFSVFPLENKEGRFGSYWYHEDTQCYFDDFDQYKMIKAMCRLTCSVCDKMEESSSNKSKRKARFRDIYQLKGHLFHQHSLFMCRLCLEGRKVFICEQKLYTKAQLKQHEYTGDSEVDGTESERGGFQGHPFCEFCRTPFYGDNELYTHMNTEHFKCHICQRRNPGKYEYYKNYDDLEIHFRQEHFLCEDEACLIKKFIVFPSEAEMKRHNAQEHGGRMSRSKHNATLQDMDATTSGPSRKRARKGLAAEQPTHEHEHVSDDPEQAEKLSGYGLLSINILADAHGRFQKMSTTPLLAGRTLDWGLLESYGQRARLEGIIPPRWRRLFDLPDHQYKVLTLEFFSTFHYKGGKSLTDTHGVEFTLGGQHRHMSIADFAVRMGFYTQEETKQPIFTKSFRTVSVREIQVGIDSSVLKDWWPTIGDFAYTDRLSTSLIRDPLHRYLHRVVTGTFTARYESIEKVTLDDLLVLYCLLHPADGNIACLLLRSLARSRTSASRICQGAYVTMIAQTLGILDAYDLESLEPGPVTTRITERDMVQMSILSDTEPRHFMDARPMAITATVDEDTSQSLPRPPPASHARRTPSTSEPPVTLASLRDEMRARMDWQDEVLRLLAADRGITLPPHPAASSSRRDDPAGDDSV